MQLMLRRFAKDARGVAAIEFAVLVPLLLLVFLAVVELSNFIMQNRRAHQAATLAAEFLSRDGDNLLRVSERHVVEDIWMIVNPTAHLATVPRAGQWANGYSRALSSIAFEDEEDCEAEDCPIVPKVEWSFVFQDIISNPVYVRCDVDVVANGAGIDGEKIQEGFVGRAPVVVADFTYPYIPIFQGWLFPTLELHARAARKTRNGVMLDHESDEFVTRC
jgi:Flp pilus assembly pilin Flp